jgi:transposase-like protein
VGLPFFVCDANVSMSGWGTALPVYLLAERPGGPWVLLGGSLLTVGADADGVEVSLRAGRLVCPACTGSLIPWGFARPRSVRTADGPVRLRPRRSMCVGCGQTHVLLSLVSLLRRADSAAVIGVALTARAAGVGHARIAAGLAVASSTVRGWLRRFGSRAEEIRAAFTVLTRDLDPDPPPIEATGSAFADAARAVLSAAAAAGARWPFVFTVSAWEFAGAVTNGRLLSPSGAEMLTNTTRPWAEHR